MSRPSIYKSEAGRDKLLASYEAYLPLLRTEFERLYIETRFGRTHMLVTGPADAMPVMILQGGNCISPVTLSWFSGLFGDYRIYAPDTVGHPGYSAETRISARDNSFALWISDLMAHLRLQMCAFIGPSYGAGIILRLAAFMPDKISCSVLVCPAGLALGPKMNMLRSIMLPMLFYLRTGSDKQLQRIADAMSAQSMKEADKRIIGDIFTHVKLERSMPKLAAREELLAYTAPTLVIAGTKDLFFPASAVMRQAEHVIGNLMHARTYDMGHFPSERHTEQLNKDIRQFLHAGCSGSLPTGKPGYGTT